MIKIESKLIGTSALIVSVSIHLILAAILFGIPSYALTVFKSNYGTKLEEPIEASPEYPSLFE